MNILDLLSDLHQHERIGESERGLDDAKRRIHDVSDDVTALKQEVSLLLSVSGALIDLLQRAGVASDQEIKDAIARSTAELQKLTPDVCWKCRSAYNRKLNRCVHCGHVNS